MKIAPCRACYCCPVSPQWLLSSSVLLSPAEAPPSGMSKNGYFFQEMGESEPPPGHMNAPYTKFSTLAGLPHWKTKQPMIKTHERRSVDKKKCDLLITMGKEIDGSFFIWMLPIMCIVQYIHSERCELKIRAAAQTQKSLPALTLHCIWI